MTLKTPKKHKQRFEHSTYDCEDAQIEEIFQRAEKMGYELISIVPNEDKGRGFYILFFKRPV